MVQNLIYNLCESFIKNIDGIASITKNTPPLEEILAPATFEITANYADGYYWTTFYTSMANYLAPDGVLVLKVNFNGSQFIRLDVEDGIINKRQGVVLRSSTSSITLTKTYSKSSDDYSDNSLIGTDYLITNPGNAYGLNYGLSHGLSFYRLSSTGRIKANKAYLIMPITYLTQWKIVGNSQVHTDPYLTSWKVSGNSVVDNNTIMSCGDLGQDGKYHVKISNSATIYDIPLTAPLRKVNDVADTIEFPSGTDGKALVTRNLSSVDLGNTRPTSMTTSTSDYNRWRLNDVPFNMKRALSADKAPNVLCATFVSVGPGVTYNRPANPSISISISDNVFILYSDSFAQLSANEVKAALDGVTAIVELKTPTTELVDVSPFPVSATDTYTSANVTPYSAFEYKKNVEIWSCGEYNATDGKYHILVQPQGGSIADIALTEPLRKVNNVADTIEFPSGTEGKALVTRNIMSGILGEYTWNRSSNRLRTTDIVGMIAAPPSNSAAADIICATYPTLSTNQSGLEQESNIAVASSGNLFLYDTEYPDITTLAIREQLIAKIQDMEIIFRLVTPTTELVDAPQIAEADSYSCVISQGAKAVSWSSFETK